MASCILEALAARRLPLQKFRILHKAIAATDGNMHEPRHAVEESEPKEIKLNEPKAWTENKPRDARPFAACVQHLRMQAGVSVLLLEVGAQSPRFGLVQQVAAQAPDRPLTNDALVNRVGAPGGAFAVE